MQLKVVTYASFASPGIQPDEIGQILAVSRANNARDAITGLLMFNGAAFVQVLEGPDAAIDQLYNRLANDPRHCEIERHHDLLIRSRIFDGWGMGFVQIDGGWLEGQYAVADALARDMPSSIRQLLVSMATTLPFD